MDREPRKWPNVRAQAHRCRSGRAESDSTAILGLSMIVQRETLSCVTARTMSGVRVALAGLPDVIAVHLAPDVDPQAATVGELRGLTEVPHPIAIVDPLP